MLPKTPHNSPLPLISHHFPKLPPQPLFLLQAIPLLSHGVKLLFGFFFNDNTNTFSFFFF